MGQTPGVKGAQIRKKSSGLEGTQRSEDCEKPEKKNRVGQGPWNQRPPIQGPWEKEG